MKNIPDGIVGGIVIFITEVNLLAQKTIQEAFDQAASEYDNHAVIQRRVAYHLAKLIGDSSPQSILEIGCGTGFLTESLLNKFPETLYYATDIAPSMIKVCSNKLHNIPNLQTFVMDGERLALPPYSPQFFDLICSNLSFQWFEDLPKSLESLWERANTLGFTTLVQGTFEEWEVFCHQAGSLSLVRPFLSEEGLNNLCKSLNPDHFTIEIRNEVETFENPLDFLKSLKKIGAHTPQQGALEHNNIGFLRQLMESHTKGTLFSITYKVAYCILSRSQ